jgi:hypothetical protein
MVYPVESIKREMLMAISAVRSLSSRKIFPALRALTIMPEIYRFAQLLLTIGLEMLK